MRDRRVHLIVALIAAVAVLACSGCASAKKFAEIEAQLKDKESYVGNLEAENSDLKGQVAKGREEIRRLQAELQQAYQQSKTPPPPPVPAPGTAAATGEPVTPPQDRPLLTLAGDMFPSGKETLTAAGKQRLQSAIAQLRAAASESYLRIEGHTDSSPIRKTKDRFQSNIELSAARAMAVLSYLETVGRIPPSKMYVAAFGPHRPIADNNSQSGQEQNRRVEILQTEK